MKYIALEEDKAVALEKGFEVGVSRPDSGTTHLITFYHKGTTDTKRGKAIGTLDTAHALTGVTSLNAAEKTASQVKSKSNHDKWLSVAGCLMMSTMGSLSPMIDFVRHIDQHGQNQWRNVLTGQQFQKLANDYFTDHEARRAASGAEASE